MIQIVNTLISSALQVITFSLIPFIFFVFRRAKKASFFQYIGLFHAIPKSIRFSVLISLLFLAAGITMIFVDDGIRLVVITPPSVTGKIRQMDSTGVAMVVILIVAVFKTAFSEEIFFRGFIANRLINLWGYTAGNMVQALIFGVVHVGLFWKLMNPGLFALVFIFTLSTLAGWMIGMVKEKYANGSIIPGWIAHGLGNTLSYSIIVFAI